MSDYKNPRPSATASAADPCVVYDNAVSFDKLINNDEIVTTYKGVAIKSLGNLLNELEDEALSRSRVSSPVVLTDSQSSVEFGGFNASLSAYYIVAPLGSDTPSYRLFKDVHYTVADESTETISLLTTFPAGYSIVATSLDPTGSGVVAADSQFLTVADLQAATGIQNGYMANVVGLGDAKFLISASGTTVNAGDIAMASGQVAVLQPAADGSYNVEWFGADGTIDTGTDQVSFFNIAALRATQEENGTNKSPIIDITSGSFRLNSAVTNKATWRKSPDAKIIGLAGVSPTFEDDTSYLTGTVITYSGVDQQRTLSIGDPKFTVQKYTGKGYAAEITANSDDAAGGITATTHASGSNTANQACIAGTFVGLQNNNSVVKPTWAVYLEGVRDVGNEQAVFCMESTMFNRGLLVKASPYGKIHLPQTGQPAWNLWLTSGGTQAGVQDCNPATGAIGIKANDDVPFDKGIIFKEGALSSPAIAIATPDSYKWAWYGETTGGDEVVSCRISGALPSNGQYAVDLYNATTLALESWISTPYHLTFSVNNQADIGSASLRFKTLYLQNSPDVVSDTTKKTSKRSLSTDEVNAGLALARNVQMFKWISEVEQKGEASAYYHTSVMAQEAWQILIDNNLTPTDYGFISNSDSGWSVMPNELALLMCAATVQRQDEIETRLAALEAL